MKNQLAVVSGLHEQDVATGYAGVILVGSLEKKYPFAVKDFIRQWLLPQKELTPISGTKEWRRYHPHESHVQGALKRAARMEKLTRRVKLHTFRHSFAAHLLQADCDIRTVQTMPAHTGVRTTMMYAHCIPGKTTKEAKNQLNFQVPFHREI
ncbi:MAG: tyrosine-type recombinase/integrase [Thiomonas sp.]|uniref:tyrosine-type recombinase/integrase n=1 Tax=Thiomonas sp. TaxID=2047785 RepID=UPI002A3725D9|nr:tyrosine-type recombinase/integrase [Thiomonas sp.]MDY0331772.1 tyrosine-type recombinase/integrase [Thiomonas sp.]